MKYISNKKMILFSLCVLIIVVATCTTTVHIAYTNNQSNNLKVDAMTDLIQNLDTHVRELAEENELKTDIIFTQGQEIHLKDSMLTMVEGENQNLKNRLRYTQRKLKTTEQELQNYASILDSLQDSTGLQLFHLDPNR